MQTLRFADPITVTQYPLAVAGGADWQRDGDDGWRVTIPLPPLGSGDMVAPSLCVLNRGDYRFGFSLATVDKAYPLRCQPSAADNGSYADPADTRVRTAIDCYHLNADPGPCHLEVRYQGGDRPERYLLTVSVRPTDIDPMPDPALPSVRASTPPRWSQMLANPRIASRICSPVSTAMVIGTHRAGVDVNAVVADCFDPVSGMYGLWPLAIRAASRWGLLGAVELVDGWQPVLACLERGLPVVASIRFGPDALPGAPLKATGGHLVVVHGVDGGTVLVNDPAAPDHGSVARRYPVGPFGQAWFRHRGAAYMLIP